MKATLAVAFAMILVAFAHTSEAIRCPRENGALVTIVANPENCKTFYICNDGIPYLMWCTEGLEFNAEKSVCDWPEHAKCHPRPPSTAPSTSTTTTTSAPPTPTESTIPTTSVTPNSNRIDTLES